MISKELAEMSHRDSIQNAVNEPRSTEKTDTPVTRGRSGPVRYELLGADGKVWAAHPSVHELARLAKLYWPDQEQDEDRTGNGWDVQVEGC
jgi:hypothetical protein